MRILSLVAMLALAAHCARCAEVPSPPRSAVVFAHVTVIDVSGKAPQTDQSVVVGDGRITALGKAREVAAPRNAKVVDASGKYLIPGLWDMHVHFMIKSYGALFVANGVTGVRVMWGNPPDDEKILPPGFHNRWREEFSAGKAIGPRMVIASGIVDGPNPIWPGSVVVRNAAEGREAVRAAKKAGVDFIKVYELIPADAYFAIAEECKNLGIPFAGHVPQVITAAQASDAGQRTMEHLFGILPGCSTRQDELMKKRVETLKDSKGLATLRAIWDREHDVVRDTYSEVKAQALFARLKTNGTWQCPTLAVSRAVSWIDDPAFTNDPRLKYTPASVQAFWNPKNDFRFKTKTPADYARMKKDFEREVALSAAMKKAGVGFLAGTDELNPYCFPGFSLHDELALLVRAGFSPLEALQSATINPALYLGKEKTLGTIEVGKDADLVLLDANPLDDIHNTTKIRAVVANGRLYDHGALDRILADAEKSAAKTKTAGTNKLPKDQGQRTKD
jgi:imidazolonepropionase-like amidohydrolase